MENIAKQTFIYDIDFDKLRENYPEVFWLDGVLSLHQFLENNRFVYIPKVGYQVDHILSEEEIEHIIRYIKEELVWMIECATFFRCLKIGDPKSVWHLFPRELTKEELEELEEVAMRG